MMGATRCASPRRRVGAALALVAGAATIVVAVVALLQELLAGLAVALAWQGVLRTRLARAVLLVLAGIAVVVALSVLLAARLFADLALIGVAAAVTSSTGRHEAIMVSRRRAC